MHVRLWGGLGNQMLQWAFGRSMSIARNEEVTYDHLSIDTDPKRSYSLGAYNIDVPMAAPSGPVFTESGMYYDTAAAQAPSGTTYAGNWFSEKYFNREVILKELAYPAGIPNEATLQVTEQITGAANSAFIGVRHGDFLHCTEQANWHGTLSLEYYLRAMNMVRAYAPGTQFFVFSDDPEWCQNNFNSSDITNVVANHPGDGNEAGTEHWDIFLMSLCQHAIIANSSFHWWGAWLHPKQTDRIVIAPKRWLKAVDDVGDTVPERWTRI